MSGICGAWSFDCNEPDLDAVLASLERRGPDGTHRWAEGPIALGHTLLATTPEALVEQLPLTDHASGCTITADARIDNRDELIAALDLGGEARIIGDGELILRAYVKWGEDCPKHLLGDFAFAILDPRRQRLFCARDHFGMRQFSYTFWPGHCFVFATDPESVVTHPHLIKQVNEGRIADFLDDLEGIDLTSTMFKNVYRLPPAHSLTIDARGVAITRYWRLNPRPELKGLSNEAYAEEFLSHLNEAVRCRLRSVGPVGSMLSGGLDSNSVSAVAAHLLGLEGRSLHTFSAIGPAPDLCVETRTIGIATAVPGTKRHFVNHQSLGEYQADLERLWNGAQPFDYTMTLPRAVYLAARRSDVKVVLDGVAADFVLSSGGAIANMLRQWHVKKAWAEAQGEERYWGPSWPASKAFLLAVWSVAVPRSVRKMRRIIAEKFREKDGHPLIPRAFAERIDLKRRRQQYRNHASDERLSNQNFRRRSILHPHNVAGRERYDRVASGAGVEARDPFLDLRLVEFCLSLPWTQLQEGGWPKIIMRRAMATLLPDEVIWRTGKEHLGSQFTRSFSRALPGWNQQLLDSAQSISDVAKLQPSREGNVPAGPARRLDDDFKLYALLLWRKSNRITSLSD